MSNKVDFEVNGTKHSLRFGMTSVNILQDKSFSLTKTKGSELTTWEMFILIIYSGLCNHADVAETNRPSFEEANEIAEEVGYDDELQKNIYALWEDSKPVKVMMERLNGKQKKSEAES